MRIRLAWCAGCACFHQDSAGKEAGAHIDRTLKHRSTAAASHRVVLRLPHGLRAPSPFLQRSVNTALAPGSQLVLRLARFPF